MTIQKILFLVLGTIIFASCTTLTLQPADFAWPIEAVLKTDNKGFVKEDRYSLNFDTKALFFKETQDSLGYAGKSLRIIRNFEGYYFMTAAGFKNVYVFSADNNSFTLNNTIGFGETTLDNPAFNQRKPFIQLINDGQSYKLTSGGIEEGVQ